MKFRSNVLGYSVLGVDDEAAHECAPILKVNNSLFMLFMIHSFPLHFSWYLSIELTLYLGTIYSNIGEYVFIYFFSALQVSSDFTIDCSSDRSTQVSSIYSTQITCFEDEILSALA